MTWPTRPGEPPYPDDDEAYGDEADRPPRGSRPQPTFTPHDAAPQERQPAQERQAPQEPRAPGPSFTPHEPDAYQQPHEPPAYRPPRDPVREPQPPAPPHQTSAPRPAEPARPTFTPREPEQLQPPAYQPREHIREPEQYQQPVYQPREHADYTPPPKASAPPVAPARPRSGPQPTFTPHQAPGSSGPHPTQAAGSGPQRAPAAYSAQAPAPPEQAATQAPPGKHAPGRKSRRPTFTPHFAPSPDSTGAFPPPGYMPPMYAPSPGGYEAPTVQIPSLAKLREPTAEYAAPGGRDTALRPGAEPAVEQPRPSLAESSQVMALGTLVSRITGFLRTFVFVIALGTGPLADAYNNSNTLPNTVYYLMLGGIFTSVVVPLLVRSAKNDPDRGEGYAERIFSLGAITLFAVTFIGTLAAGPLVDLYASSITNQSEHHLMVVFAYFFIPQIFFYGMDSLLGAILNTKGKFGPNMWTPVINNVVVIAIGGLFIVTEGLHKSPATISGGGVKLLGIGTTLGIVIQSIALFPIVRRAGFSMRLVLDFRRDEVREIGRMAGWMLGYVVSQWAGYVVVQNVANAASARAGGGSGTGYSAYSYAWSLFQLPYAVVGISVISALLPRMSGHATDRRYSLVREDFSIGVRLASVIVMPAAIFLAVLGPPLCEVLFSYGSSSVADARYIGEVFGVFSLGLIGYMLTQLQLRVFYSFHDNRTPALIGILMFAVGVIGDLVALNVLPSHQVVIGLAAAYGLVTLTGALVAWPLLLRRVGSLDGWRITRSLIRMLLATAPGLVFALVVMRVTGAVLHQGAAYGLVSLIIGGGGAMLLYAACARALGIEEYRTLINSVMSRFRR